MEVGLLIAIALALTFALTNGFHDAANAIATLVATRGATPGQAIAVSSVFNMVGAVALGTAVADTIGKIVEVSPDETVATIGAGLAGATAWNLLTWWRGLPSSSGQALVGGLVGAGVAEGGWAAINMGGFDGWHPVGLIGTIVVLLVSPVIGFLFGFLLLRALRRVSRRFTRRWDRPLVGTEWAAAAALSYSHGSNDAQKSMGVIAALLVATGETSSFTIPLWVKLATGLAVTLGTALGGWRIVKTIGTKIFGLKPVDSLASQSASTAVILGASLVGGPVSTTQVVASSVVGVGGGRRRWRHVRWGVVRDIGLAWVTTIPAAAILSVLALYTWKGVAAL